MLTILEEDENLIATKISEKITAADYEKILPIITEKQQYGKFRWYFELEDFEGWELKGLYKELNFYIRLAKPGENSNGGRGEVDGMSKGSDETFHFRRNEVFRACRKRNCPRMDKKNLNKPEITLALKIPPPV